MKKEIGILKSVVEECKLHATRLDYAYSNISFLIPFNAKKVERLKAEEISYLDQYIFRFSKLQDALGQKLFKAVLDVLGENFHNKPFLDIFHRLEQLDIVENYPLWQELRVIWNEIAHEYEENPSEMAEKLNEILNGKEALENYLNMVLRYVKNKKLED
jgi:hypothetical protein